MKLEIDNRSDSRGFWFRTKLITVSFHFWKIWRYNQSNQWGWKAQVMFNTGAGHRWGRTAYLAWRAKGGVLWRPRPRVLRKLRCGFTQNANAIPYHFYS